MLIIRGPERERVLSGAGTKHEFFGTTQVHYHLDNETSSWTFPILSVSGLMIQGNKVVFEETYSYIAHRDGDRTELVVQGNAYWQSWKLLCAMEDLELRDVEEPAFVLPSDLSMSQGFLTKS